MTADPKPKKVVKPAKLEGDTPTMRLFGLLEIIAQKDQYFTLQGLVKETGLPKPTMHRMLQQMEASGILQREGGGRYYTTGIRLRRLAENLLLNSTAHAARHIILKELVERVGESCNITALSGGEVLYLDRVDTEAPLRFYLHPGSRVPLHCSATGKLFLAQMAPSQRRRLLGRHIPLKQYTENTITDHAELEAEILRVRRDGYAMDLEEFLPGLLCVGVLVPPLEEGARSNLGLAIQAPTMRMPAARALEHLPDLQRTARALAAVEEQAYAE